MSQPQEQADPRTGAEAGANPFSPRAALALVLFGSLVFLALLYFIGSGMTGGSPNNGGGHAGGKGLNGYAAFAALLERRGYAVRQLRSEAGLDDAGLLVLTPPAYADGAELDKIVQARRRFGPTLVISPKWNAVPLPAGSSGAKRGWVTLSETVSPQWNGFLDDVTVRVAPMAGGWQDHAGRGALPDPRKVQSGRGSRLVPLVVGQSDGRMLAGYLHDGGYYPNLEAVALSAPVAEGEDDGLYPLVIVFEPDLIDNYGMAKLENAQLAARLVQAAAGGDRTVIFDLTLNGFKRTPNLLTLAFTPPFLAATLCLLLAAVVAAWRAFLRFGPPRRAGRTIAFGKHALVANAAGLIRRSRRLHLISAPYATRARERLARTLALPRMADAAATEDAIDRALASRQSGGAPFSVIAARLRAARSPHDIMKAAQDIHALERTLTR